MALSSYLAEEDKSAHYLEVPFRNFNIALVDNATAEYSFLTEYFSGNSFHQVSRKFQEIFEPTFAIGQSVDQISDRVQRRLPWHPALCSPKSALCL